MRRCIAGFLADVPAASSSLAIRTGPMEAYSIVAPSGVTVSFSFDGADYSTPAPITPDGVYTAPFVIVTNPAISAITVSFHGRETCL